MRVKDATIGVIADLEAADAMASMRLENARLRTILNGIAILPELPGSATMPADVALRHVVSAARNSLGMEPLCR